MSLKSVYEEVFQYVRNKTNQHTVTIGQVMGYFCESNVDPDIKNKMGITIIAMLNDRKEKLNIPDEHIKLIVEKVIDDMQ